ncbi:MAG TPA: hypothetical protein VGL83_07515 [Stellaceae bacterium]|jgi:hypothetical protein
MKKILSSTARAAWFAASLIITSHPALALPQPTPLAVAQHIEALTAGGLYDPTGAMLDGGVN